MKITAIVLAGGAGTRAGFPKNKLLIKTGALTPLELSVSAFLREDISEIVVVLSPIDKAEGERLLGHIPNLVLVQGGETRTQSVKNALAAATGDIVLIHDGARPFVTDKIISDCIESVLDFGTGICSLPATDTFVLAENERITSVPERSALYSVQTPQGFFTEDIKKAYDKIENETFTDDSSVYAQFIAKPRLFTGDICNRKLTYAEDFTLSGDRIGFGTDTHAFGAERFYVTLCGVEIPSASGLIAHSDGDVALHALMDAMLSAAGLRDIGYYFPDTDSRYRGASSMNMLRYVNKLLQNEGFCVKNASISIQAERPKMKNYIVKMKENVATLLKLPPSAVGIAAGTNEGLGYVGEGKGITVNATVLLKAISK